jgi:glucokinase-like ROK family protein
MGLTRAGVTTIVQELERLGLVREAESGQATGGRRPILLEMNPKLGIIGAIDVGATHLGILLADFSAQVLYEDEAPFDINNGPEAGLRMIETRLRACLEQSCLPPGSLLALGVGVPGPVVAQAGMVSAPPIMPGWDRFPIRERLAKAFGCPVALDNDANLGALGEWAYGSGRGEPNLAYIKVGTGIGAGLLFNGQLYGGVTGSAGEIGHITIDEHGPRCNCGNRGCLEAVAGGGAIARQAREAVRSGRRTQLSAIQPLEQINASHVAAAAQMGDLVAQQIITTAGGYLGTAIAGLVNLFNPGLVVVGGGVAQVGDLLLEPIRKTVQQRSLRSAAQAVRITAATLGRRSSGMGAAVRAIDLALEALLKEPSNGKRG